MRGLTLLAAFVFYFFVVSSVATELKWIRPEQSGTRVVAICDETIATGGWDGSILLWRRADRSYIRPLRTNAERVNQIAFSTDGKQLISLESTRDYNQIVRVWDIASGANTQLGPTMRAGPTCGVGYLQASNQFFVAYGKIDFYSALDYAKTGDMELAGGMRAMALSQDGTQLAVSGSTYVGYDQIRVISLESGKYKTFPARVDGVIALAFSHDGKKLASTMYDDTSISIWDIASGVREKTLTGHVRTPNSLAFNPTKYELVSVSDDAVVKCGM